MLSEFYSKRDLPSFKKRCPMQATTAPPTSPSSSSSYQQVMSKLYEKLDEIKNKSEELLRQREQFDIDINDEKECRIREIENQLASLQKYMSLLEKKIDLMTPIELD